MRLQDTVVLVTGASAGIERVAAARFAEVGGKALVADLAVAADRVRLADTAVAAFGRVNVLVNNARSS